MPTTIFLGNPEYFCNAMTITSKGFVIHITKAFGEECFIPSATCLIIFKFIPSKSSLVMPGFLGTPAVMIITSEFFVSSYLFVPLISTSNPSTDEDCAMSKAFPFATPSATSNKTTSPSSFKAIK